MPNKAELYEQRTQVLGVNQSFLRFRKCRTNAGGCEEPAECDCHLRFRIVSLIHLYIYIYNYIVSSVALEGNISLLEVFFSRGLKQMEGK